MVDFLESQVIKAALVKFLGSAVVGGFRAYIIKYLVKNILFDKAIEPLVKEAFLSAGYGLDVLEGHIKIKKLKEARESGNEEDYNRRIDDLFN